MNKDQITVYSKNDEIATAFEAELTIVDGTQASRVVIVDITTREELAGAAGDTRKQLILVQARKDLRSGSLGSFLTAGAQDAFASLKKDSTNFSRIVRIIGPPMSDKDIEVNGLAKGKTLDQNFNIDTHRSFKPFYEKQQPMVYPTQHELAGETITSDGKAVYEYSFLCTGEPTHTGMDIALDTVGVTSVSVATA